jgi:hypothetical protein
VLFRENPTPQPVERGMRNEENPDNTDIFFNAAS